MANYEKYLQSPPDMPTGEKTSVRYGCSYRIEAARKQALLDAPDIAHVVNCVNEALGLCGIQAVPKPVVESFCIDAEGYPLIDYEAIKKGYGLADVGDIVWIKLDEQGFPIVVAVSDDIYFGTPPASSAEYGERIIVRNSSGSEKEIPLHTTHSIITHALSRKVDESKVLIFPLRSIPEPLRRGDVEQIIGNYLVECGVPLLDLYSHNF
ncbi:MAG: hypothetical protein RR413_12305 [Christensenellaceae bacterium]